MAENVEINDCSLVSSLQHKLGDSHLTMPLTYCISRTPSILFRHRPSAFLPNYFSIGPMHYSNKELPSGTEKIKLKYLKDTLSRVRRSTMMSEDQILKECVDAVKCIEKEASSYYEGHDFSAEMGDKFREILLLDGCFLIELFRKNAPGVHVERDDPIFSTSCMLQYLHHDLMLLENQIPWLVLQTLFDKTKHPSETLSLIELVLKFFANTFSCHASQNTCDFEREHIKHILDLLRWSLVLPSEVYRKHSRSEWQPIRSITRLREADVKFKKVVRKSILDIKFRNYTLEIPSLRIQETTETILRNLIACEQCLPNCPPIFTCYAKLLNELIDTPRDVEILCCEKEMFDDWLSQDDAIFDNRLSLDDAAQFFSNLYVDTYVKEFYYSELCNDLNLYCKGSWSRASAYWQRNYFSKPWGIACAYAFIMFILALWQTLGNLSKKWSH